MYKISPITVLDEDKDLYETHIGLDNEEQTLLLSAWGKTEKESRLNAVACAWRLALDVSENIMIKEKTTVRHPDLAQPDESLKR